MPPPTSQPKKPDLAAQNTERNQYIPSFIAKKPFYVPESASQDDYLEHQRLQSQNTSDTLANAKWYDRGVKRGPAATKYRKGACENCGAMTHKKKDCLDRTRKQGARWTGRDIQADELVGDVKLGWDAKRDRWNGYNATEYQAVVDEYNDLDTIRKLQQDATGAGDDADVEGARYEEETDMGRQQSTSTRQLRLREDTAKYLLNLDLDSAKYDPKTRSMQDAGPGTDSASALIAEEGFVRKGGDAAAFEKAQRYAWETQERGDPSKVHLQANPTAGEITMKKAAKETEEKKTAQRKALLDKYGGSEHLQPAPLRDVQVTESERFVEYDARGGIKGAPKTNLKSKYAEDVFPSNHTSVWGSWWSDFRWGYACCHSVVKNSYCTGDAGKLAFAEEQRLKAGLEEDENEPPKAIEAPPDPKEEQRDLEAETARRKRTIEEMTEGIADQEMEDYRRKRTNASDPMAAMLGKDGLVS